MSVADLSVADLRPEIDVEVEITPVARSFSVSARVEDAGPADVVVRPGLSGFVDEAVVAIGERVSVLWLSSEGARAVPAEVATVERGAAPRWHLKVVGPAEAIQRRQAVRARVALPVVAVVNGVDLPGDIVDISEGGVRAVVEPYGVTPIAGSTVSMTVQLEEGPITAAAEVVRQQTLDARWALSLRFTDLPEKEQDRLRRRVFRAIREERARHSD